MDTTHEKVAFIKIQNLDYMKNNEYYGPIADGYTLFGAQLNPQIGYQVSKNLSIEAGAFLRKDFGGKKLATADPTFSLRYHKKDFKMIFGNINGSLSHQLIEPMYNFERVITNRLENGAQFMLNKKHYDFDVWIDWQTMIYKESGGNEKVWGGLNANVGKLKCGNSEFKLPFQVTLLHTGGQIDTANTYSYTHWNANGGFAFSRTLNKRHLQKWTFDARYVARVSYLFTPAQSKSTGYGYYFNTGLSAFDADLLLSYWYGYNYVSDYGGFLYSSQSSTVVYANSYKVERSVLIARLTKRIQLADHVYLTLRFEPDYDFGLEFFEYSYGFYISLDEHIWLKKKTKPTAAE